MHGDPCLCLTRVAPFSVCQASCPRKGTCGFDSGDSTSAAGGTGIIGRSSTCPCRRDRSSRGRVMSVFLTFMRDGRCAGLQTRRPQRTALQLRLHLPMSPRGQRSHGQRSSRQRPRAPMMTPRRRPLLAQGTAAPRIVAGARVVPTAGVRRATRTACVPRAGASSLWPARAVACRRARSADRAAGAPTTTATTATASLPVTPAG